MIEVVISIKGGKQLAKIDIENTSKSNGDTADYSVQVAVDTADGIALYQRPIYAFPRKRLNVLGLVRLALSTLEEKELSLDANPDASNSSQKKLSWLNIFR